jgi:rSAM/selenodomain-associated transferase 2
MPTLSIVIPTLDAASSLPATIASVREVADAELIVTDGGSSDGTVACARALGAVVVTAPRGRGSQLAAGARVARGAWLLFVHADTVLAPGWRRPVEAVMAGEPERVGYFRFTLDDDSPAARRLERRVAWRCRVLGLPYGDQGLLIAQQKYDALGGYRPMPLMEDVDLARRVGRRRLVALDHPAITAPTRYRRAGYRWRSARNLLCLGLYFLGLPPRVLVKLYR